MTIVETMPQKYLHRCDTCVSHIGHECLNAVAFVVDGHPNELRAPLPDDLCTDYSAEPDLLTDRLTKILTSRPV